MPADGNDHALKTLENGKVPDCRMANAATAQNFLFRLQDQDDKRSKKRAKLNGLIDGNPPYVPGTLREQNRADATNVNFGTARAYLESGSGAFYDLATEGPGRMEIQTSHGNDENRIQWSRALSQHADYDLETDKCWDSRLQTSIKSTVHLGKGPFFYDDPHSVTPLAIPEKDLLLPDFAPADLDLWELAFVCFDYYPPRLYAKIENGNAAKEMGWDVEHCKLCIQNAVDKKQEERRTKDWAWYQDQIKTNSFDYYGGDYVCKLAHAFWREFDGTISHGIIERQDSGTKGTKYLYLKTHYYQSFYQIIHPMYFDSGRDDLANTVTGLGVKQYGPMEFENRLLCDLMDAARAPKILFKPTNAEAHEKFKLARFGPWALLSPGVDGQQTPIQGLMQDGLAMFRTSSELMRSNLGSYRQPVEMDKPGNPETATKERIKASAQGSLSNTTFNRYYRQLDMLYAERVRRLCNLNTTDQRAKEFQRRCLDDGVPRECFGRIETVRAVRVLGGGTPFMRQQSTATILGIMQRLPEEGQNNLIDDFISSHAGPSAVRRWNPGRKTSMELADQTERATLQIAAAKEGIAAVLSPSQNPLVFASLFLQAATQAVQTVQKGADPRTVVPFVELLGRAIAGHLKRMEGDPLRKSAIMPLEKQLRRLGAIVDKLKKMIAERAKQAKAQQQKTQQTLSDIQLKALETKAKIQDRNIKTRAGLQDRALKTKQSLAIADANAASQIRLNHFRALQE